MEGQKTLHVFEYMHDSKTLQHVQHSMSYLKFYSALNCSHFHSKKSRYRQNQISRTILSVNIVFKG